MLPSAPIHCPYCGESIDIVIDDSIEEQSYIEDCQVCCRPIQIAVVIDADGMPIVTATAEDEV